MTGSPSRSCRYAATAAYRGRPGSSSPSAASPARGPSASPDGDRAVEPGDRVGAEPDQLVVPPHDLHPVGLLGPGGVRVERRDRRLRLVLAQAVPRERALQDLDAFGDQRGVPAAAVLRGERHQRAVRAGAGRAAGVVQQHQREQPGDLLVIDAGSEPTGQPDRLGGEVDVAGVALVEDQVEHPQHRRDVAGAVEPLPGEGALGAADPLGHGRLRHQVGLGDLPGGEAADGAQREGDRRGRGERGVRAQEVQPQGVVHRPRGPRRRLAAGPLLAAAARGPGPRGIEEPPPGRPRPARPPGPGAGRRARPGARRRGRPGRRPRRRRSRRRGGPGPRSRPGSACAEGPGPARRPRPAHSVTVGGALRNGRTSSHSWIGFPPAPGAADSSAASS